MGFPGESDGKESLPAMQEMRVRSLRSRRSPGGGHGNPLQYSGLENPMDTGARRATVHGVAKSRTGLSNFHFHNCNSHRSRKKLICLILHFSMISSKPAAFWLTWGPGFLACPSFQTEVTACIDLCRLHPGLQRCMKAELQTIPFPTT